MPVRFPTLIRSILTSTVGVDGAIIVVDSGP
jgi:hypothetical protein